MDQTLIDNHLAAVRARLEKQGATALELAEMAEAASRELGSREISNTRRERLMAEARLYDVMVAEQTPPPDWADPEAYAEKLAESDPSKAGHLEHFIQLDKLHQKALDANEALIAAKGEGKPKAVLERLDAELKKATDRVIEHGTKSPVHAQQEQAANQKREADRLRAAGTELQGHPDPLVREHGESLISQADSNE